MFPCSKPAVPPELELVETEDQITHEVTLEDALDPQVGAGWLVGFGWVLTVADSGWMGGAVR